MLSPAVATNTSTDPLRGYLSVQVDLLKYIDRAPVNIFIQPIRDGAPILYCRAGLPFDHHQLWGIGDVGLRYVYVRTEESQDFGNHLLESIVWPTEQDSAAVANRFAALQLAVAIEIEQAVRLIDCSKFVSLSGQIGRDIVSFIASRNVVPRDLFRIARHDFSTFVHVTNVASYSVVLAERLGITNDKELEQIATAAMLHDLGKRFIPARILNKPIRLNPEERALVELHPTRGYVELCERPELTTGQLMIVYQHHERIDGNGYPVRVFGSDIHPWAKLVAVADVFDALTGKRPYRRSIAVENALQILARNAGTHFEPEMVRCWISAMKKV